MKESLGGIANEALVSHVQRLVARECELLGEIIRYLQEIDHRKAYVELGYSSLFAFCTEALGYSESAAYRRIQAARSSRETPELLEKLSQGNLSLCAVGELSKVSPDVRPELIALSEGKPKEAVSALVARHLPVQARNAEKVTVKKVEVLPEPPLFSSPAPVEPVRYTVTVELTAEEYHLLEEVKALSGTYSRKETVVRALHVYNSR